MVNLTHTQKFVLDLARRSCLVIRHGQLQGSFKAMIARKMVDRYTPLTPYQVSSYQDLVHLGLVKSVDTDKSDVAKVVILTDVGQELVESLL